MPRSRILARQCPRDASLAEKLAFYSMPEPNSACQLWLAGCDGYGYGWVTFQGVYRFAHHVAWALHNGRAVPKGAHVLHSCDVRCCINGDHLFLGNQQTNMADKVAKGRQARGVAHSEAASGAWRLIKLLRANDPEALAIVADPRALKVIAADVGVHWKTIRRLKRKALLAVHPTIPAEQSVAA